MECGGERIAIGNKEYLMKGIENNDKLPTLYRLKLIK